MSAQHCITNLIALGFSHEEALRAALALDWDDRESYVSLEWDRMRAGQAGVLNPDS